MMKRIAVMGAGSLGTVLGAFIARKGLDVTLVDSNAEHVAALNERGAHVVGSTDFIQPVKACTPEKMEGEFDLFIYMAKQTANEVAIPQMVAHCHKDTIICSCQNGIPEYAVAKYWPKDHICGAAVGWAAVWNGPGESRLVNDLDKITFHLGTLEGPVAPWIDDVKRVLECIAVVYVTEHLMDDRWAKLIINAGFSGLGTVMGCDYAGILADPAGLKCATMVCNECVKACHADGVHPVPFYVEWDTAADFTDEAGEKECERQILEGMAPYGGVVPSMLQDLRKGRRCEIGQLNGLVCETGTKYGIATPYNDMVVKVVREIEDGKRTPGVQNLEAFKGL